MTLTIDVPSELEQRLEAEAKRQGVSKDAFVRITLEERLMAETEEKLKDGDSDASVTLPRTIRGDLPVRDRSREYTWLAQHRDEYIGQWVALDRENLIASGDDLKRVVRTAREAGAPDALMVLVEPSDALPFAGF